MGTWAILLLALGLAMDATAVAATRGLVATRVSGRDALRIGVLFGGFQAAMPALGWALGAGLGSAIQAVDHWIAWGILTLLGGRMIWQALRGGEAEADDGHLEWKALLPLAVATSIDALAAGVTLPLAGAPFAFTITAIGLVTAALSAAALLAGRRLGAHFGSRVEVLGGVILAGLGAKILIEHLANGT
ncbi:MAG: manganese efflux pump MntP family protein [Myxococcota bacterium]